jgi:hypothetical protein
MMRWPSASHAKADVGSADEAPTAKAATAPMNKLRTGYSRFERDVCHGFATRPPAASRFDDAREVRRTVEGAEELGVACGTSGEPSKGRGPRQRRVW